MCWTITICLGWGRKRVGLEDSRQGFWSLDPKLGLRELVANNPNQRGSGGNLRDERAYAFIPWGRPWWQQASWRSQRPHLFLQQKRWLVRTRESLADNTLRGAHEWTLNLTRLPERLWEACRPEVARQLEWSGCQVTYESLTAGSHDKTVTLGLAQGRQTRHCLLLSEAIEGVSSHSQSKASLLIPTAYREIFHS